MLQGCGNSHGEQGEAPPVQWGKPSPTQGSMLGMDPRGTRKDPHTQADLPGRQTALQSRSCPVSKGTNNKKTPTPNLIPA